jgi:hypothetical protein
MNGLARFAKTDLVRCDYTITHFSEYLDAVFPSCRAKISAMQKNSVRPFDCGGSTSIYAMKTASPCEVN